MHERLLAVGRLPATWDVVDRGGAKELTWRGVLIVECDPQVRGLLREIFDAAGYACELADDGREALEVFRARRATLVVTDVADVKTAIESLKLGAYAVLMKPINSAELLITAGRALERRWLLIERRQHQQADGQLQEADRTTLGWAGLSQRDVLILVVEEDRALRELLQQIFDFDSAGYGVRAGRRRGGRAQSVP
jgi:FixJ family two-component response regulator